MNSCVALWNSTPRLIPSVFIDSVFFFCTYLVVQLIYYVGVVRSSSLPFFSYHLFPRSRDAEEKTKNWWCCAECRFFLFLLRCSVRPFVRFIYYYYTIYKYTNILKSFPIINFWLFLLLFEIIITKPMGRFGKAPSFCICPIIQRHTCLRTRHHRPFGGEQTALHNKVGIVTAQS